MYMTLCTTFLSCVQASGAVFIVLLFQFWYSMNDMQKKTEPQEVCVHAHTADMCCVCFASLLSVAHSFVSQPPKTPFTLTVNLD